MKADTLHVDLKNKDYVAWRKFLGEAEHWSREQIAEYQLREVQWIVKHAYSKTVAYRELYDRAGISPDDIQTLADLQRVPFVEKEMLRDNLDGYSFIGEGGTYVTTGGSTGIPLGMYRSQSAFAKELASKAHQYERIGWEEGDRQIVFRGTQIDSPDRTIFMPQFNELRCSTYHMVPEWLEVFYQKALEYQPEWLRCYPSAGYMLARWLEETGHEYPKLKGILCTSENLYEYQKALFSEVFVGARVFSHYGHYEMAVLAGFCEHTDAYHVLPQYGYAELIDEEGQPVREPGQMGEIVATSFIMDATPFIRYRTRDFATLKGWECSACGRPYQLWERIEGRLQEMIITETGRYISIAVINFHDDVFDHLKQIQFYQEEKGKVTLRYIPKDTCTEAILENIRDRLAEKLGDDVALSLRAVSDIPLTSRGKQRFSIQKIPHALVDAEIGL